MVFITFLQCILGYTEHKQGFRKDHAKLSRLEKQRVICLPLKRQKMQQKQTNGASHIRQKQNL